MMAYASYLPPKSDIANNALIIALADAGAAFLAGFAVFSTLGYYAYTEGIPIDKIISSSIPLAFITFPTIINEFPIFRQLFGVLFFLMLFFLGIDSAFSLVEAFSCGIIDKWRLRRTPLLLSIGLIGLGIGLLFATNAGILWLDIVDYAPLVLLVLFGTEIYRGTYSSYGGYPRAAESLGGYGLLAFFLLLSIIFMKKRARVFA